MENESQSDTEEEEALNLVGQCIDEIQQDIDTTIRETDQVDEMLEKVADTNNSYIATNLQNIVKSSSSRIDQIEEAIKGLPQSLPDHQKKLKSRIKEFGNISSGSKAIQKEIKSINE